LFAHCASLSVNAVYESYNRKPRAMAHADRLAQRVDLDMVAAGWKPTVENFLGRVTKARILGAVREARGNQAAQLIDHLKKDEMAAKAEELLAGSGWLPEPLRTPGRALPKPVEVTTIDTPDSPTMSTGEETAANGGETAMAEDGEPAEDDPTAIEAHPIAAE
jgi:ParB family transcriptional regulator, chromosome partitioning protein